MKYYTIEEEWSRAKIRQTQAVRLQNTITQALKSSFYKKKYGRLGITPQLISSVDDVQKLPFTYKEDLRSAYPFGFLAVDQSEIVRLHASSGTTGTPTVICHTQDDLDKIGRASCRERV